MVCAMNMKSLGRRKCATGVLLDLGRHWRRSVQQHQSPAPAQAVLIKPSPFDPSSEAADVNEVETTSPPALPPRSPDTSTSAETTKPTKKASHEAP
ncbi:hypothetical protein MRX96_047101 [Rhipicephalus microplus]